MQETRPEDREREPADSPDSADHPPSERIAFWVFVAYLGAAVPLLLSFGSYRWFFSDEWSFLADRSVSFHDLFRDHNQHWTTLPVLIYRGMYSVFGIRSYWPYQLLLIGLHLLTAALLRVVMRRAGVGPWIATVAAGSFVLLGAAEDNILWAFQIGFVGTLVFGLTQLLLADHDGPIDRRDWLGLGAGLLALMTTGQAPPLIVAAGLVCVFRRRWAAALLHTVPLGLLYLTWLRLADVEPYAPVEGFPFTASVYVKWMWNGAIGLFMGLGHFMPFAWALVALLIGGTLVAWRSDGATALLRRAAVPAALLAAAVLSMSVAAPSRFFLGEQAARGGRYVGMLAAMTLPALAVATAAVVRRWPRVAPVFLLILVPIVFNATDFGDDPLLTPSYFAAQRSFVAALPEQPVVTDVPSWVRPNDGIYGQPGVTVGWLLEAKREGKLPPPTGPLDPLTLQTLPLQLGVAATGGGVPDGLRCETHSEPVALDPELGEQWLFATPVAVSGRSPSGASTRWLGFGSGVFEATLPDLHLLVGPAAGLKEFELCR